MKVFFRNIFIEDPIHSLKILGMDLQWIVKIFRNPDRGFSKTGVIKEDILNITLYNTLLKRPYLYFYRLNR